MRENSILVSYRSKNGKEYETLLTYDPDRIDADLYAEQWAAKKGVEILDVEID